MKFAQVKKHLNSEIIKSTYFVSGSDAFLAQTTVNHFKNLVSDFAELNISQFDAGASESEIINACETLPMMSDYRVVLCFDYKGECGEILTYLKNPNPSTVLVFINEKLTSNFKNVVSLMEIIECDKLEISHINGWISACVARNNCSISAAAARLLIDFCSQSMTRICKETEKLASFKMGEAIEENDIVSLVKPDIDYQMYELSEAIGTGNHKKAMSVLKSLFDANVASVALLGMIYNHFRRLLYCLINSSDSELHKKLGVKEFAVTKAKQQARNFTPRRLKQICDDFHSYDYKFKNGELTDKMALEMYVFKILLGA